MPSPDTKGRREVLLPDWATNRCHDCGELFLPGYGAVWSSRQPDRWTHGGLKRCQEQAEYLTRNPDALALQASLHEQALVEISQGLHRFVSECDEEHWNEEVSGIVFAAIASAERGLDAHRLIDGRPKEHLYA